MPVTESRKMIDTLRKSGADARLTVYPDLAHDCWTITYRDSGFTSGSSTIPSRMALALLQREARGGTLKTGVPAVHTL